MIENELKTSIIDTLIGNVQGSDATTVVLVLIAVWLITRPKEKFSKHALELTLKGIFFLAAGSITASVIVRAFELL